MVTYNQPLVGLFLIFFSHGRRSRLSEDADGSEDGEGGSAADEDTPGDLGVGAGGILSAGTVGTEGNVVG